MDGLLKPGGVGKVVKVTKGDPLPYRVVIGGREQRNRASDMELILPEDPVLLSALATLRGCLYANALLALSSDTVGPTADLSRLDLTLDSISQLGPALQKASSTARLDLRSNPLLGDDAGARAVALALAGSAVTSVELSGCGAGEEALEEVRAACSANSNRTLPAPADQAFTGRGAIAFDTPH